jgi:hypothetical protein
VASRRALRRRLGSNLSPAHARTDDRDCRWAGRGRLRTSTRRRLRAGRGLCLACQSAGSLGAGAACVHLCIRRRRQSSSWARSGACKLPGFCNAELACIPLPAMAPPDWLAPHLSQEPAPPQSPSAATRRPGRQPESPAVLQQAGRSSISGPAPLAGVRALAGILAASGHALEESPISSLASIRKPCCLSATSTGEALPWPCTSPAPTSAAAASAPAAAAPASGVRTVAKTSAGEAAAASCRPASAPASKPGVALCRSNAVAPATEDAAAAAATGVATPSNTSVSWRCQMMPVVGLVDSGGWSAELGAANGVTTPSKMSPPAGVPGSELTPCRCSSCWRVLIAVRPCGIRNCGRSVSACLTRGRPSTHTHRCTLPGRRRAAHMCIGCAPAGFTWGGANRAVPATASATAAGAKVGSCSPPEAAAGAAAPSAA